MLASEYLIACLSESMVSVPLDTYNFFYGDLTLALLLLQARSHFTPSVFITRSPKQTNLTVSLLDGVSAPVISGRSSSFRHGIRIRRSEMNHGCQISYTFITSIRPLEEEGLASHGDDLRWAEVGILVCQIVLDLHLTESRLPGLYGAKIVIPQLATPDRRACHLLPWLSKNTYVCHGARIPANCKLHRSPIQPHLPDVKSYRIFNITFIVFFVRSSRSVSVKLQLHGSRIVSWDVCVTCVISANVM